MKGQEEPSDHSVGPHLRKKRAEEGGLGRKSFRRHQSSEKVLFRSKGSL